MSNFEIMIPGAEQLPAHIINPELARQANEDAAANISSGAPARIKLNSKQFCLVDSGGEEKIVNHKEMTEGPDGDLYLKVVVLRARKALQKTYYVGEYDKDGDQKAPDCFSNDGERPDPSIKTPQCDVCANCPMNAYGSARKGEGKACSDTKILAVFIPNKGVHQLKVTPAALRNWRKYVDKLSAAGIPVGNVFTLVGFVPEETYPVLRFQYGGPIPEGAVGKLAEMAESPEALDIINGKISAGAEAATPVAQPKQEAKPEPKQETAEDLGLGEEPAKQEAKPEPVKANPMEDLGLGDEPAKQEAAPAEVVTDDDIAAELGL